MIRRTFLALTLGAAAVVALGPGAPTRAARPSVLDRIEKDKVLRVGWAVWYPYVYRDPKSNQVQGVSYELAQELAKSFGARVEWVEDSWATLPAGVQAGKFDITNLMAITPPRAQVVDFSEPVTKHDLSLLAPKDEVAKTKGWEDWDRPGVRIVVTLGSNTDMFLTEKFKKAEIVRLKTSGENILALVSGRVNAHASTVDALKTIQREHSQMAIVPGSFGHSDVAFALPQGDAPFAGRVNDFVRKVKKSGHIKQLLEKYGLDASFAAD
jgi:polar amino acid transport system substrate-binding protein